MIRRLMVVAMAIFFVAGCSAFDHDPEPYVGFDESVIPFNPFLSAGQYEGLYTGTVTLDRVDEACSTVVDVQGEAMPIKLDVLQAGNLVSIQFEDDAEETGKMVEKKVTVVKRQTDDTRMYHVEFTDEGLEGKVEVFIGQNMIEPCASYTLSCTRGVAEAEDEAVVEEETEAEGEATEE